MSTPCAVKDCKAPSFDCFGTRLCIQHGTQANLARDAAGLAAADWPAVVKAVDAWVEQRNRKGKAVGT